MSDRILGQLRIAKDSSVPIYQQLQRQLEDLIANGTWRPSEPLPSETMLAARLEISVMTVRQAMTQLVNKGLIYREKGRGTFVIPRPLEHTLHRLESFSEDMRARGLNPASHTLSFEVVPAPDHIAASLNIEPGTSVLHLRRLRLVEGRPVALHDAHVNTIQITRAELDAVGSLYTLLEQRGIELAEADETLEATTADAVTGELLQVPRGAPLLKVTRLTWDRRHMPVEVVTALYRADFYRYTIHLRR
jgi:GntR family transcriptional regulator